jgi:hypothetical protein
MMSEMKYIRGTIQQISQALTDKSDWDALHRSIAFPDGVDFHDYVCTDAKTAVCEVPTGGDGVAATCGHAAMQC